MTGDKFTWQEGDIVVTPPKENNEEVEDTR